MARFIITTSDGFIEHGTFVKASSKEEAVNIFKTAPFYRIFKGEQIISVETEAEAECVIEE